MRIHKVFFWLLIALTKSPTKTITGGSSIPEVRRTFFDQASVNEVEAFEIYTKSTMEKNDENNVIIVQEALATGTDLIVIYVLLGELIIGDIRSHWNYPAVREVESALNQKKRR